MPEIEDLDFVSFAGLVWLLDFEFFELVMSNVFVPFFLIERIDLILFEGN